MSENPLLTCGSLCIKLVMWRFNSFYVFSPRKLLNIQQICKSYNAMAFMWHHCDIFTPGIDYEQLQYVIPSNWLGIMKVLYLGSINLWGVWHVDLTIKYRSWLYVRWGIFHHNCNSSVTSMEKENQVSQQLVTLFGIRKRWSKQINHLDNKIYYLINHWSWLWNESRLHPYHIDVIGKHQWITWAAKSHHGNCQGIN